MSQEAETANTEHRPSRVRKWLRRFVVLSLLAGTGMAWAYNTYVINNPGPHISDQHIQSLLTQDSPVYYRDGKTVMSSITYQNSADDLNHRYYITYDELPQHWINAIIAMEDQNYWTHHGVEPVGILKAVLRNLRGQRSGGSTLTQQTAKNLFKRTDCLNVKTAAHIPGMSCT